MSTCNAIRNRDPNSIKKYVFPNLADSILHFLLFIYLSQLILMVVSVVGHQCYKAYRHFLVVSLILTLLSFAERHENAIFQVSSSSMSEMEEVSWFKRGKEISQIQDQFLWKLSAPWNPKVETPPSHIKNQSRTDKEKCHSRLPITRPNYKPCLNMSIGTDKNCGACVRTIEAVGNVQWKRILYIWLLIKFTTYFKQRDIVYIFRFIF